MRAIGVPENTPIDSGEALKRDAAEAVKDDRKPAGPGKR
jgi:hypothetical protein